LLGGLAASSQQDALFTQYMFNKLVVNPAYAGSQEILSVDLLNRTQWVGIDGAPQTLTFGAHTAMRNRKVGLGLYGYRDVLGPQVSQGLMGTYAYRLIFPNSTLSFGLQGGIKYFNIDWDQIRVKHEDPYFYPQEVQKITPDFNLGMYFQSPRFFAGISSKQLLENEYGVTNLPEGGTSFSRLLRHFYLMTGVVFPMDEKILFRPSLMAKYVKNAPLQVDLNASLLFGNALWVGASYRTEKALAFMAGANSIFYGEKLLTTANPQADKDMQLFKRLGIQPEARQEHDDEVHQAAIEQALIEQRDSRLFYNAAL